MSYAKQEWIDGSGKAHYALTGERMKHIEDGIAIAASESQVGPVPIIKSGDNLEVPSLWGGAQQGNLIYQTDGNLGMQILDVADPDYPKVIGSGEFSAVASWAKSIAVNDNYAFVIEDNGLMWVMDCSDPSNLTEFMGPITTNLGDGGVQDNTAAGNAVVEYPLLFISGSGNGGAMVKIYDISDPASLSLIDTITFPDDNSNWEPPVMWLHSATSDGDTIKLITGNDGGSEADTWKVISSTAPYSSITETTLSVPAGGPPMGAAWIDNATVALTQGSNSAHLRLWDVSTDSEISNLAFTAQTNLGREPRHLLYQDGHVYFNGDNFNYGVTVVNIRDRANPVRVGAYVSSISGTQIVWPFLKGGRLITYRSASTGAYAVWGGQALTAANLNAVTSLDATNIVVVDNGMMPATPDPLTIYLEREA